MDMTNKQYQDYVNSKAKPSPIWKNMLWAFCTGGAICTLGQGLLEGYRAMGLEEEMAGCAVSVTLIFAAALATGLGVFDGWPSTPGRAPWCPSPALQTRWPPPPWSSRARGW